MKLNWIYLSLDYISIDFTSGIFQIYFTYAQSNMCKSIFYYLQIRIEKQAIMFTIIITIYDIFQHISGLKRVGFGKQINGKLEILLKCRRLVNLSSFRYCCNTFEKVSNQVYHEFTAYPINASIDLYFLQVPLLCNNTVSDNDLYRCVTPTGIIELMFSLVSICR